MRSRRNRILVLVTAAESLVFVREVVEELVGQGFKVCVGTCLPADADRDLPLGAAEVHVPFAREVSPVRDLVALGSLVWLIARMRPRLVYAGTPKASLLGMLASWMCRVPIRVFAVHGLRYETSTGLWRTVLQACERRAAACSTHVLVNSASIRSVILSDRIAPEGKVHLLGSGSTRGVDLQRFSTGGSVGACRVDFAVDQFDYVVGFVGRLTRDKGVDDLVEVFCESVAPTRSVGLLLVGRFEEGDPVDVQTRTRIRCDPRIVHVEWMADTAPVYKAMDVLAFPSYREGLPNVPLEAQASGVPVVGYSATGTVDAVHTGELVQAGDRAALAERILILLDDPVRRHRLAECARSDMEARFNSKTVVRMRAEFMIEAMQNEEQLEFKKMKLSRNGVPWL